MQIDFKNYNRPWIFPEYLCLFGNIKEGRFVKVLEYDNVYEHMDHNFERTFNYCFDFSYRSTLAGTVYVYRGGFYIEFSLSYQHTYKSSHCNHFSMPMCQHFTDKGRFTQFFIDRVSDVMAVKYKSTIEDIVGATTRYLNQRKGR